MNLTSTLAHLRRVKSPLSKKHPHFKARDVHGTYLGKLCPSETPEGTDVGLTKYLAIMSKITVGADTKVLEEKLKELKADIMVFMLSEKQTKMLCIPRRKGHRQGQGPAGIFAEEVRKNRRLGVISGEINVCYIKKLNEVHINADRGRARKPYIVVENGASKFTPELLERLKSKEIDFNYLVRRGIIEYLDAEEEENTMVALSLEEIDEKTTHLEIDKASILGLTMNLTSSLNTTR